MDTVQRLPSLRDQALAQLRKAIVLGDLRPGSLHSEQSIADRIGSSRTPIREALLQLAQEGMVVFIPHRGARIAELDPIHLANVMQFRAAIEGCGASRMAARPNPSRLAGLNEELERQEKIIADGDRFAWVKANIDFHRKIVEACDNRLMMDSFATLAIHTERLGYRMISRAQRMSESLDEHSAIVDAIGRGDVDRARTMAEEHLYITTVLMKQLFADAGIAYADESAGLKKKRGRNAKGE